MHGETDETWIELPRNGKKQFYLVFGVFQANVDTCGFGFGTLSSGKCPGTFGVRFKMADPRVRGVPS